MPFPFLAAAGLILGAIGSRKKANAEKAAKEDENALSIYEIERRKALDQTNFDYGKAGTEDRLRYANAISKARGYALPQFDNSSRRSTNLVQPATPTLNKPKGPSFWDTVLGAGQGMVGGLTTEANLNNARGNPLPGANDGMAEDEAAALDSSMNTDQDAQEAAGIPDLLGTRKKATSPGQPVRL